MLEKITDNYYTKTIKDFTLVQIELRNDLRNYNYILHHKPSNQTVAIDPTDANVTMQALKHFDYGLEQIWVTHHHNDHIGGIIELVQHYNCDVIGNANDAKRIPAISNFMREGEVFDFAGVEVEILNMDGHTIGHIAYHISELNLLFAGDTIFSLGCGRVFEGTHTQMWQSLSKIKALPPETLLCISHEYTLDNAHFALHLRPENQYILKRYEEVKQLRGKKLPTVPTLLALEVKTNPFLLCDSANDFGTIRLLKDSFKKS